MPDALAVVRMRFDPRGLATIEELFLNAYCLYYNSQRTAAITTLMVQRHMKAYEAAGEVPFFILRYADLRLRIPCSNRLS